jgi:hypothetical protein
MTDPETSFRATEEGIPDVIFTDVVLIRAAIAGSPAAAAFARVLSYYLTYKLINYDRHLEIEQIVRMGIWQLTDRIDKFEEEIGKLRATVHYAPARNTMLEDGRWYELRKELSGIKNMVEQAALSDASMTYLRSAHTKIERVERQLTKMLPAPDNDAKPPDANFLNTLVNDIDWGARLPKRTHINTRARWAFADHNILTIADLVASSERLLLSSDGVGLLTLTSIKAILAEHGLELHK